MREREQAKKHKSVSGWVVEIIIKKNYYDISDLLKPTKLGILFAYISEKALLHTHIHTHGHKSLPNLFYRAWPNAGSCKLSAW